MLLSHNPLSRPPEFVGVYAAWLTTLTTLAAILETVTMGIGLSKFGGHEYIPRVMVLRTVRELSVGIVVAAAVFSWIWCTHRWTPASVRASFRVVGLRALIVMPIAYVLACTATLAISSVITFALYGLPPRDFAFAASKTVDAVDVGIGMFSMLTQALLVLTIAWFVMPRLATVSWGLRWKLIAAWISLAVFRAVVALVSAGRPNQA